MKKKEDYFNVERFLYITFSSTKITKKIGLNKYLLNGVLTMKGISKSIEIDFTLSENISKLTLKGNLELKRRSYKVGGSFLVLSDTVKLNFIIVNKIEDQVN